MAVDRQLGGKYLDLSPLVARLSSTVLSCFLHHFSLQFTLFYTIPFSYFGEIFDPKPTTEVSEWQSLIVAAVLTIVEGSWSWPSSVDSFPSVEWSWVSWISGKTLLKKQTGSEYQTDLKHIYIFKLPLSFYKVTSCTIDKCLLYRAPR